MTLQEKIASAKERLDDRSGRISINSGGLLIGEKFIPKHSITSLEIIELKYCGEISNKESRHSGKGMLLSIGGILFSMYGCAASQDRYNRYTEMSIFWAAAIGIFLISILYFKSLNGRASDITYALLVRTSERETQPLIHPEKPFLDLVRERIWKTFE